MCALAFLEVVMSAAFRRLVEDGGDVSVNTGLRAAEKLQSVLDKRDPGDEIADMRRQVNMITDAVKAVVPQEMWGDIAEKLEELELARLSWLRLDDHRCASWPIRANRAAASSGPSVESSTGSNTSSSLRKCSSRMADSPTSW